LNPKELPNTEIWKSAEIQKWNSADFVFSIFRLYKK